MGHDELNQIKAVLKEYDACNAKVELILAVINRNGSKSVAVSYIKGVCNNKHITSSTKIGRIMDYVKKREGELKNV